MTADIHELYQQLILDHGRRPRNFGESPQANCIFEGFNPLCGDRLTVYITQRADLIASATFVGSGCAISMASASLMTEAILGKSLSQAKILFNQFHQLLTKQDASADWQQLGKLAALAGVAEFPARVKCATLAWHTMLEAIVTGTGCKLQPSQIPSSPALLPQTGEGS